MGTGADGLLKELQLAPGEGIAGTVFSTAARPGWWTTCASDPAFSPPLR